MTEVSPPPEKKRHEDDWQPEATLSMDRDNVDPTGFRKGEDVRVSGKVIAISRGRQFKDGVAIRIALSDGQMIHVHPDHVKSNRKAKEVKDDGKSE